MALNTKFPTHPTLGAEFYACLAEELSHVDRGTGERCDAAGLQLAYRPVSPLAATTQRTEILERLTQC